MNISQSPPDSTEGDLITAEEVMDRLSSVAPLKKLASLCVLEGVRCGDEWRFRRTELEAWIDRQLAVLQTVST